MGGPQQISISVRRWKKRLSSNVCDVFVSMKIAMPSLKQWTCHETVHVNRIPGTQSKGLKTKEENIVNFGRAFSHNA
jgi:hypothetical protein